jgi:hypothetical protein
MSLQEELEDELSISTGHSFSNLKITASRALQLENKWSVLIASTTKSCIALQSSRFSDSSQHAEDEIRLSAIALPSAGLAGGRAGRSVGRTGRSKQLNLVGLTLNPNWNQNQFSFVTPTGKTKREYNSLQSSLIRLITPLVQTLVQ